jgi:uncharacterized OB-fold protein
MTRSEARQSGQLKYADADSEFYWAGLATHRLLLQSCNRCSQPWFPPMPTCPECGNRDWSIDQVNPTGTIYSSVRTFVDFDGLTHAKDLPFVVLAVDLESGPRIFGRLLDLSMEPVQMGRRVRGVFYDNQGVTQLGFKYTTEKHEPITRDGA